MTRAQHRLLFERWEAHKRRFGIAGLVDERGNPVPEFLLTDTHKRILMGEGVAEKEPGKEAGQDEADQV